MAESRESREWAIRCHARLIACTTALKTMKYYHTYVLCLRKRTPVTMLGCDTRIDHARCHRYLQGRKSAE